MSGSLSEKRPWIAALLAVLVTGLGHAYLRRWRRALGWVVTLFAVAVLFVDPASLEAFATGETVDTVEFAPVLVVGGLSVLDAYVLARTQNSVARVSRPAEGGHGSCPDCGRELDPELDFCQWCSARLPDAGDAAERAER